MSNRVLVLSDSLLSTNETLKYLRHRGWDAKAFSDLSSALPSILNDSYDFIFISIQFESQESALLKEISKGHLKAEWIHFSEDSSIRSIQKLNSLHDKARIYPPATGPSFDLCLIGVLNKKKTSSRSLSNSDHNSNNNEMAEFNSALKSAFQTLTQFTSSADEDLSDKTLRLIGAVTELTCSFVTAPQFSGYVITVRAANKKSEVEFLSDILKQVNALTKGSGEFYELGDIVTAPVSDVDFRSWLETESEFCQFDMLGGEEVAIGFIPTKTSQSLPFQEFSENMLKLNASELSSPNKVPSDLYIYLPKNNKFIRYIKRGDSYKSSEIQFLFLKKSDRNLWSTQLAADFLASSCSNFKRALCEREPKTA